MTTVQAPKDWKQFDDFSAGIATNRLPQTQTLAGRSLRLAFEDGREMTLAFGAEAQVRWSDQSGRGEDRADTVLVAPDTYFVDLAFASLPTEAETIIVNVKTGQTLSVRSIVREVGANPGEPRVAQIFRAGRVEGVGGDAPAPHVTRDLIGLRAHYTYSPNHVYEHTYLSSQRYAWQCLVGVQRGHGDVDLTTTYKFADNQYVFTFREFIIPVASTFYYNFNDMRSTGKFLGVTGAGRIENSPAGATIRKVSLTPYLDGQDPV